MKKYIFMAVAGMLALSSCSNDDNDEQNVQNAPRQMTFTASYGDGAQTRASISGKAVSFDTEDAFSLLSENNTTAVPFSTTDGTNFSGTANDASTYYAVYPYNSGYSFNSSTGIISGITIPEDQSAAASSTCGWDPAAPIAYATTTGSSLTFSNACALLKVTNDTGVHGVIDIWDDDNSARMIGTFELNTTTGALTATNGKSSVYVNDVPGGKTIYIAIAPCTVDDLCASFEGPDGMYAKEKTTPTTFEAGKIYDLGDVSSWE